jgi:hypothetical protein
LCVFFHAGSHSSLPPHTGPQLYRSVCVKTEEGGGRYQCRYIWSCRTTIFQQSLI